MALSRSHSPTPQPRRIVTDHAVLRFLERVKGIDVGTVRIELERRLQARGIPKLLDFAGNAQFRIHDGDATFCGRNQRIVTCYARKKAAELGRGPNGEGRQ